MVYAICNDFYPTLEKKLNRISKKCVKNGNPFIFRKIGEEVRKIHKNDHEENVKFIMVEVEGMEKFANWEFIATLENHSSGNIIRRYNTTIDVPEKFLYSGNFCEHCNSKRHRKNLYIIHNVETDEWKQVGGNCLMQYTNGLNMEYVAAWMDGITELEENNGIIGESYTPYYMVDEVISYAAEIIGKIGYFNANADLPTKRLVSYLLVNRLDDAIKKMNYDLKSFKVEFSQKDFFHDETEETVRKIMEYYENLEDSSEFVHNVQVMLKEGYVTGKNIGYLCYLPEGYAKHINKVKRDEARKAEKANSEYFGEVGKRYKNIPVQSIEVITSWETMYGRTYIYRIILENSCVLTWKTSKWLFLDDEGEKVNVEKITFTVKEHKEYKSEKQTEVTRCKIN